MNSKKRFERLETNIQTINLRSLDTSDKINKVEARVNALVKVVRDDLTVFLEDK